MSPAPRRRTSPSIGRPEAALSGRLMVVVDRCWWCHARTRGIVGVLTRDGAVVGFDDVAAGLADALDPRLLARHGIGVLRHRDSPGVLGGYVSNGCVHCDALIGRFRLADLLLDHRAGGGSYEQLAIALRVELDTPIADARTSAQTRP